MRFIMGSINVHHLVHHEVYHEVYHDVHHKVHHKVHHEVHHEVKADEPTKKEHPLRRGKGNFVFGSMRIKVADCLNLFLFVHLLIRNWIIFSQCDNSCLHLGLSKKVNLSYVNKGLPK